MLCVFDVTPAAAFIYGERHKARFYDNLQSAAVLPLAGALVHKFKCNNNHSCHFVSS